MALTLQHCAKIPACPHHLALPAAPACCRSGIVGKLLEGTAFNAGAVGRIRMLEEEGQCGEWAAAAAAAPAVAVQGMQLGWPPKAAHGSPGQHQPGPAHMLSCCCTVSAEKLPFAPAAFPWPPRRRRL